MSPCRLEGLRVGYVPYDESLRRPGDRRRFCFYADRRAVRFELADPAHEYDIVVLSARADITQWARYRPGRAKIVYDLIDSYLAVPTLEPRNLLRGTAKFLARETQRFAPNYQKAMREMCRRADAVVCTTEEQRTQILAYCPNVYPILDHHGYLISRTKQDFQTGVTLNLVWEGLAANLSGFAEIAPALAEFSRERPVALHLVTDLRYGRVLGKYLWASTEKKARGIGPSVYLYQWNEAILAPIVTACDLAVIPIARNAFMQGKPENKLLLFWRMAMPTLVSATPAYARAMKASGVDMAYQNSEQWLTGLRRYADDEAARQLAGAKGLSYCDERHGEEQLLAQWDAVFA